MVDVHDVLLRDGRTLRLRPPHATDVEAVLEFFSRLSERSFYQRFHGPRRSALVWQSRSSSRTGTTGGRTSVWSRGRRGRSGSSRSRATRVCVTSRLPRSRSPLPTNCKGTGWDPSARAARATCAEFGIERFVAEVMPDNGPMTRVFADAGFDVERELEGGVLEVRFEIGPTEAYLARVDERDHVAVAQSLRPFFAPASVAVLGASPRRGSLEVGSSETSCARTSRASPTR